MFVNLEQPVSTVRTRRFADGCYIERSRSTITTPSPSSNQLLSVPVVSSHDIGHSPEEHTLFSQTGHDPFPRFRLFSLEATSAVWLSATRTALISAPLFTLVTAWCTREHKDFGYQLVFREGKDIDRSRIFPIKRRSERETPRRFGSGLGLAKKNTKAKEKATFPTVDLQPVVLSGTFCLLEG